MTTDTPAPSPMLDRNPRALSFGGGVNSTAMILLLHDIGESPDIVMFADTGGEKPETYKHIEEMQAWSAKRRIPFVVVKNKHKTLEQNCIDRKELPSLAYGTKGCSQKWKRHPMDCYIRDEWPLAAEAWAAGRKVERFIGIDAGEFRRAKLPPDKRHIYRYPLVEHNIDRDGCIAIIRKHGIEVPPKSSCFFCPAMRKHEILELKEKHPSLLARAMAIEANSTAHTVVGLGRNWTWAGFIRADHAQMKLFPEFLNVPCDCTDEDDE